MIIQSLKKIQDSTQNIGPLLFKNQSYNQYKKENSQISLYSDSRDKNQEEDQDYQKSMIRQSRNQSIFSSFTRRNQNKQQDVSQSIENQTPNFLQQIKSKNIRDRFINNLFKNSYVLQNKYKQQFIDDYISSNSNFKNTIVQSNEKIIFQIFQPGNQLLLYWDMVGILINMISLWLSPFQAAFNFTISETLYFIIIFYLLLDVLVNLNRSTISMGEIINTRKLIIINYFKGNAFYDILSLMIWIEISVSSNNGIQQEILQIIQLIVTIKKILTNFDQFFESLYTKGIFTGLTDLITLILSIYFFAHIMACIWFYIGDKSDGYLESSWLKKQNIEHESVLFQYNYSIYWAITTIVTVGYGDITPQNWIEMTFSSIMMVLSSCVYAYSLNSIGIILKNFQDNKYQYKKMLLRLNHFMDKNKVQLELQLRARNFLKFNSFLSESHENQEEVDHIMQMMPERLRNCINNDIQLKILNKITFLKDIFTSQTVSEISKILETVYLTPEEVLYSQNEHSEPSLYYIYSGSVLIYEEKSKKILATLKAGQKFGEYQFFTGLNPKSSVKCLESAILYKINREKLLQIIKYKEKDFQRFNHIKDELFLNSDYSKCFASCQMCNIYTHEVIDCPLLSYKPDFEQRLKKDNYFVILNLRNECQRKSSQKLNSRYILRKIDMSVKSYQEEKNASLAQLSDFQSIRIQGMESGELIQTTIEGKSLGIVLDSDQIVKNQISANKISKQNSRKQTQIRPSIIPFGRKRLTQFQPDQKSTNYIAANSIQEQTLENAFEEIIFVEPIQTYHIDNIKEFKDYMPQNNLSSILKKIEKVVTKILIHSHFRIHQPSKYSFFYYVKRMSIKMKKKIQKQQVKLSIG